QSRRASGVGGQRPRSRTVRLRDLTRTRKRLDISSDHDEGRTSPIQVIQYIFLMPPRSCYGARNPFLYSKLSGACQRLLFPNIDTISGEGRKRPLSVLHDRSTAQPLLGHLAE